MTDPTPSETIAALEARIDKLELVCAEKSRLCAVAKADNARLRELLRECERRMPEVTIQQRDFCDRINAELLKGK